MGKLLDADKSVHDELRQLAGRPIKASIQIEPHVMEPDELTDAYEPYCILGVKFICGTDRLFDRTWFVYRGKREGPEWDRAKLTWKHLYQYVSDFIGAALTKAATQLTEEALYVGTLDETQLAQIFETSAELRRFYESYGSIHQPAIPYDSEFQMWISQHAFDVKQRLLGKAKANVGSDARLRFSPAEMKTLLEVLGGEQRLWQRARDIFWANQDNPEWRAIVKAEIPKLNATHYDDLLDAISQRSQGGDFTYRPIQVAVVAAARHASFDNKEEWYSPPSMSQHKMIARAVQEWRKRFEEAKQLDLRW